MRTPRVTELAGATALACTLAFSGTWARLRMVETAALTDADVAAGLDWLRAARCGEPDRPLPEVFEGSEDVPLVLTVWNRGQREQVVQVDGLPPDQGLPALAEALREVKWLCVRGALRLELDAVVGTGWLPSGGAGFALGFAEGRDGASGFVGDHFVVAPPTTLMGSRSLASWEPLPFVDRGIRLGATPEGIGSVLVAEAVARGLPAAEVHEVRRVRVRSAVEGADGQARALRKATVDRPDPDRARLQAAVVAGATYLASSQDKHGRYRYSWDPVADRTGEKGYSWARHAGVGYALAQVGRLLGAPAWIAAADRGISAMEEQLFAGPPGSRCLGQKGTCSLGTSALALLAVSEHRDASGSEAHAEVAADLAAYLRASQRPDGTFVHAWSPADGFEGARMQPFASQQAVLALAMHGRLTGDTTALDAAERGMDHLAGPYWDHFLGRWFVAQEHWSCLAAEELQRSRPKQAYATFCWQVASFYGRLLHDERSAPSPEDVGGVDATPLLVPHVGGTATMVEAMVSGLALAPDAGADPSALRAQLARGLAFLVRGQVTVHDTFWIRRPDRAIGGFYDYASRPRIRMDNVQHAISGMVRALPLYGESSPEALRSALADYGLKR